MTTAAKQRPIGVWFSVAVGILVVSIWPGRIAGARVSRYWFQHQERRLGALNESERSHLESALSEIETTEELRVLSEVAMKGETRWPTYIEMLNRLKQESKTQEGRSVIDFELGIAYAMAARMETQGKSEGMSGKYIASAQDIFQSLGWHGYSDDVLMAVAKHEFDRRNPYPKN